MATRGKQRERAAAQTEWIGSQNGRSDSRGRWEIIGDRRSRNDLSALAARNNRRNIALFETTNARIYSSQGMSGADVYASLFGGKDAYGISEIDSMGLKTYYQPLGSSGAVNDPLGQVGSIGWKCYHAAAILNQGWLVRLESGATP